MTRATPALLLALTLASAGAARCGHGATEAGLVTGAAVTAFATGERSGRLELGAAHTGSAVGTRMDAYDRHQAADALTHTRAHRTAAWVNRRTGYQYHLTPEPHHHSRERLCREFMLTALSGSGVSHDLVATACEVALGHWRVTTGPRRGRTGPGA